MLKEQRDIGNPLRLMLPSQRFFLKSFWALPKSFFIFYRISTPFLFTHACHRFEDFSEVWHLHCYYSSYVATSTHRESETHGT